MVSNRTSEIGSVFPLWLYPNDASTDLLDATQTDPKPNLAPEFVEALTKAVGHTFTPEDTLAYIYALLYAPSYRSRYADFLKRDFPRVPLTTDRKLFDALVAIGRELIALHTLDTTLLRITGFDVAGSNEVVKVRFAADAVTPASDAPPPRPSPARGGGGQDNAGKMRDGEEGEATGRVYINDAQYFDGVPQAVWEMHIGGYRVAEKWLKDRKGRLLSYDDLTHYQNVIAALARTLELQAAIDAAIDDAGGWPLA